MMDQAEEQKYWATECEKMLQRRVSLTPPELSETYAMLRTLVIVNYRALTRVLPDELKQEVRDFDANWYQLLFEAEKTYYRMGFEDAMCNVKKF